MNPTVVAAWIAASVSALTLIGTVIVQVIGFRSTKADTEQQIKAQSDQLDRTLGEQRTRTLNERFATAAEQLGSDKPAVRLAGVYAMAGLADDWPESRQTCVDVLCAYLRMPYDPDPGPLIATGPQRLAFQASREVRHTVIRVVTAHLKKDEEDPTSWHGLDLDFTGVAFDGGDFGSAWFSGGEVSFVGAQFSGGVYFTGAQFSGGRVYFDRTQFSGGKVSFVGAQFSGGRVYFSNAEFSGGRVNFSSARFSGGSVYFSNAEFSGGRVNFDSARFSGGTVSFVDGRFSGGEVSFGAAGFSGGTVSFGQARFPGGLVSFRHAEFSGGPVDFRGAQFSGSNVDFSDALDWSVPPTFPWTDTPPPGVTLPKKEDQPKA